jgi:hypothetical protein
MNYLSQYFNYRLRFELIYNAICHILKRFNLLKIDFRMLVLVYDIEP